MKQRKAKERRRRRRRRGEQRCGFQCLTVNEKKKNKQAEEKNQMNNTKQKTSGQHNIHTYICINMCVFVFSCLVYKFGSTAQFKVVRKTCSSLTHKGPPKLRDVKCGSHAYICMYQCASVCMYTCTMIDLALCL